MFFVIQLWQSASLGKSRNFEKMDYVQFWKNVPISDYFGKVTLAYFRLFWKNGVLFPNSLKKTPSPPPPRPPGQSPPPLPRTAGGAARMASFSNYFWQNTPFFKIVGNIQSFSKLFWKNTRFFQIVGNCKVSFQTILKKHSFFQNSRKSDRVTFQIILKKTCIFSK